MDEDEAKECGEFVGSEGEAKEAGEREAKQKQRIVGGEKSVGGEAVKG